MRRAPLKATTQGTQIIGTLKDVSVPVMRGKKKIEQGNSGNGGVRVSEIHFTQINSLVRTEMDAEGVC